VKAAPFEYIAATTAAEAVDALAADPDARVLAGGQSLAPLLALRLARPSRLVDIGRLPLDHVTLEAGAPRDTGPDRELRLGALVRHRGLEHDPLVAEHAPLLAEAAHHVGDAAIRNRGTLGGSLAHADPAAELPAALVALGGRVVVTGPAGTREIAARDLFEGFFVTGIEPGEVLTEVIVPGRGLTRAGSAFVEWAPRAADFALAGAAVIVTVDRAGVCTGLGAAACGVGSVPVDLVDALTRAGVVGAAGEDALWPAVASNVARECAGDDDRAELAGLLAARAVRVAIERARRGARTEVAA
jgi:carbon-monoxide dehydrogenase medium subunit